MQMMLHKSTRIQELARRHLRASTFIAKTFAEQAHFLPALLHERPRLFHDSTVKEARDRTTYNLIKVANRMSPQQIEELMAFAVDVANHLEGARRGNNRTEHRIMLNIPTTGRIIARQPQKVSKFFEADVEKLRGNPMSAGLLMDLRRMRILQDFHAGGKTAKTAVREAYPGMKNIGLSKNGDFVVVHTVERGDETRRGVVPKMQLKSLREKVNYRLARVLLYLGRGLHPDYNVSYFEDSLEAIKPRVRRISQRNENTNRFFDSIARDPRGLGKTAARLNAFLGSSSRHLTDLIEHVDRFPLPQGLPSKRALIAELEMVRGLRRRDPRQTDRFIQMVTALPLGERANLLLRMDPRTLSHLQASIRAHRINAPTTYAYIEISRAFWREFHRKVKEELS